GFDLATPLVCAVNGHARAGGFDLMLAAEIRYAVPEATFALEEVALGLYPTGNATVLLPRQIGWVHAHELLLTARPIDARRALEIGLVNRIVPRDQLMATALDTADAIAANAPLAVRETRRGVREILHLPPAGGGWRATVSASTSRSARASGPWPTSSPRRTRARAACSTSSTPRSSIASIAAKGSIGASTGGFPSRWWSAERSASRRSPIAPRGRWRGGSRRPVTCACSSRERGTMGCPPST